MNRIIAFTTLLFASGFVLEDITTAHGGSYRGPGDTVPGGGSGGGSGGPAQGGGGTPTGGSSTGPGVAGPTGPGGTTTGTGNSPRAGGQTGAATNGPDLTTWDYWWGFNKDRYLNLRASLYGGPETPDDGLFGSGGETGNRYKPSEKVIRTKIVPALVRALEKETANDIVTGCLIALAKIGDVRREDGQSEFEPIMKRFLSDPNQEIAETAAVALGILANETSVDNLAQLATDSSAGRKLVGTTEVRYRTRAFATYGLGLIGARAPKNEVRQEVVRILVGILAQPATSTRDVKVAAVTALGLVTLDIDASGGERDRADPCASRQTEIAYLKAFFQDTTNHHQIRAHVPTALARLLRNAPANLRDGVASLLIAALDEQSKEKDDVQQSCVLALGQLGDTDTDAIDVEIRKTLKRMTDDGDLQSKNYSLIALAEVGGRPGSGEANELGQKLCRDHLLTHLEGKSHLRPWAGLSIGVMERELLDGGKSASSKAKAMLRRSLAAAGDPATVGAYAIGAAICNDVESKPLLRQKLENVSDEHGKGYVCVAIGLLSDHEMRGRLTAIVQGSKFKPALLNQAAIGLGLLGDKDLVPQLCTTLREAKSLASQAAVASALGFSGDSRSIDPLVEMLVRKEGITDSARGFAAVALGIVADKEPLPWNSKLSAHINYRANTPTLTSVEGTGILDIL